jgi:uncharacterized membrane protein (UPF0127 family)
MSENKTKHWIKVVSKTVIGTLFYFFFLIYTPTIYALAQGFWENSFYDSRVIIVGDTAIRVKVLDTLEERQKGLSNTESLEPDHGMLFIFDKEDDHGIWMKDMNYPIDIIWLDRFGKIVYFEKNISPDTFPDVFKSGKQTAYVIEVNAGFIDKNNIKLGDSIDLY